MAKMTKVQQAEMMKAREGLRTILKPGMTVHTILRHRSSSGMSRRISLVIATADGVRDITFDAAKAMGEPVKGRAGYVQDVGITAGGCGMDMGFHLVYNLGRTLFPDGFGIAGKFPHGHEIRPATKEIAAAAVAKGATFRGRNGDTSGWDSDGGYALEHRWL